MIGRALSTQQTEGHWKQFYFWNDQALLLTVPARGQLPWCLRVVLDLFFQMLPFQSLMVITLHAEAGYHSWWFFFLLITLHLQNNSLHCINWDKTYFDLLCAAPAADFLHLGPHNTVYIAKRILSQQLISTKVIWERFCSQNHDAIEKQCQKLYFLKAVMTAIK